MGALHRAWIATSLAVLAATGCVTRGSFDELEAQKRELEASNRELVGEVARLEAQRAELAEGLAEVEAEKAVLADTYTQLVAELRTEVQTGQVEIEQLRDGVRLNVSDELLFASGSASLGEQGRALIERVAGQINDEAAIVTVEGHTDDVAVGPGLKRRFPTNWELAGARAASVVRLLAENGIDPTRLRAVSRGPFAPLVPNDTAEGRARNRRTEILLRPVGG